MDRQLRKARRTLKDLGEFLDMAATATEESGTLPGFNDLNNREYEELMDDLNSLDRAHTKVARWFEDGE